MLESIGGACCGETQSALERGAGGREGGQVEMTAAVAERPQGQQDCELLP